MASNNSFASECVDQSAFKDILRSVVGAVSIVATGQGEKRRGLTVTAASSLCVDPPMVLVCINRNAEAHDVILESGAFSWNVLSTNQVSLAQRFASMDGSKGASRFSMAEWGRFQLAVQFSWPRLAALTARRKAQFLRARTQLQ